MAIDNHHRSEYSRTNTNRNIPISPMAAASVGSRFATTCFLCAYLPNYSDRLSCLEFDENAPSWRRLLNSGLRRSSRCDVDTFKDSILDANLRRRRDQSAMGMHSLFISPSRLEFDEAVHSWRRLLNSGLRCSPRDIDTCMDSIPNVLKRRHRDQAVLDVMTDHVSNGERKVRRPLLRANPLRGGGCTSTLYLPSPHGPLAHDRLGVYVLCANNLAVPGVVDHGGTGTLQLPSSHGPLAHDRLGVFVLCADDPAVLGWWTTKPRSSGRGRGAASRSPISRTSRHRHLSTGDACSNHSDLLILRTSTCAGRGGAPSRTSWHHPSIGIEFVRSVFHRHTSRRPMGPKLMTVWGCAWCSSTTSSC